MKALEILRNQEQLLPEEAQSKKIKSHVKDLNSLMAEMDNQIKSFTSFKDEQTDGELANKIIVAKSLAEFFANNKILRVDLVVESYRNQEKAKLAEFYGVKTKLLDTLRTILKESQKEAVVSAFDIYEGQFQRCESGHEIIILNGRNSSVLESFIREIDEFVVVKGNFDNLDAQEVDFNTEVLDRNIELCTRKNNEMNGSKSGKLSKLEAVINKLHEVGKHVVAFYTYKETLLDIGCNPKNVKIYENELSKAYIPLKKLLQKEFGIELEDICEVVVNEEEYSDEVEVNTTNTWENDQPSLTENIVYDQPIVHDLHADTAPADNSIITADISPSTPVEDTHDLLEQNNYGNPFETTTASTTETYKPAQTSTIPETETIPTSNPFENVSTPTPSEIWASENYEEATTTSENLFETTTETYSNPFERNTSSAETTISNPFERTTTSSIEHEENTVSTNPFEQNSNYSNPFETNRESNSGIDNSTFTPTSNMFEEDKPKPNPFSTTNMFED